VQKAGWVCAWALGALMAAAVPFVFQHVSWRNAAIMQEANELVEQASTAFENAAEIFGKRHQASFRFTFDLPQEFPQTRISVTGAVPASYRDPEFRDANRIWSERFDQILGEIDYFLDRPVGLEEVVRRREIIGFDCSEPLIGQLKEKKFQYRSLKVQFAILDHCFRRFRNEADKLTSLYSEVTSQDDTAVLVSSLRVRLNELRDKQLSDIHTHANIFRCYARKRVDFLRTVRTTLIERSIWGDVPRTFYNFGPPKRNVFTRYAADAANDHFDETDFACGTL
jgi:hypothetical protein